jgi:F-type H+-transporting ATPase subunit delta
LSSQVVARRYASALADVAIARGEEREIQDELIAWESMMESNPQVEEIFGNPTIPYEQKKRVLNEIIKRTKVRLPTANFLQILLRNQRLTELGEINKRLTSVLDERAGIVAAQVTTARPVSEDTKYTLYKRLVAITGKDVRLSFGTDDRLIGGMVTRVGSTVYDGSIRNQLQLMGAKLAGK